MPRSSTTTCSMPPTPGRSTSPIRNELTGIPESVLDEARAAAEADGKPGWKLTLHMPCYLPVVSYADNRALRATLHRAYATRASDLGASAAWDNGPAIGRLLLLRREAAQLLGYPNFAALSLVPKMAKSVDDVLLFLRDLARRAKPYALRDYAELKAFAAAELGIADLQPWDRAYASEKLKSRKFAFSEQQVRRYFPEGKVLEGLFRVAETLYGISIRASEAATWHTDVRFFDVVDASGALIGQFYLDNYARPGKQGGAWQDDAINRRRAGAHVQHPVSYLTCNLSAPTGDEPATFTHDEVITLFHEFGHGLHHLLTRVEVAGVSGIQGVEWDAVELPSQFMENFCWEWDVLSKMTAHVDTGEPLPRELFDRMLAARNFHSGLAIIGQVESGLFDMLLHSGVRTRRRRVAAGRARCRAARDRRDPAGALRPLHALVLAHFCRRLRGWILQLQVGGGALRGRFQRVRGGRRAVAGRRRAVSATRCSRVAAAATRWSRLWRFAVGAPNSTRFCGIMEL